MLQPYLLRLAEGKRPEEFLFGLGERSGRPLRRHNMYEMVQVICRRAGVPYNSSNACGTDGEFFRTMERTSPGLLAGSAGVAFANSPPPSLHKVSDIEPSAGTRGECAVDLHCAADLEATGLHARSTDRPSTTKLHTVSLGGALNTAYRTIIARGGNRNALPPSYPRRQQNKRPQPDCELATCSSDHVESPSAYWHSIRPAESTRPVELFP